MAFASRDADLFGVTAGRIRSSDVIRPFHGVSGFEIDTDASMARARAFEPLLLPGQAFSHGSALLIRGAPIRDDGLIHLSVDFPRTPPRGVGVAGHSLRRRPLTMLDGLPVSTAAGAWVESAAMLTVDELVAAADFLLTGPRVRGVRAPGLVTRDELVVELTAAARRPGARRAAAALDLARPGVDSRRETELRLIIVDAGLPEPETDIAVQVAGGVILHSDLGYRHQRIALEYEGDGHRTDRRTWARDIRRRELFEDVHWRVVRVTSRDLDEGRDELIRRIEDLLRTRRADSRF